MSAVDLDTPIPAPSLVAVVTQPGKPGRKKTSVAKILDDVRFAAAEATDRQVPLTKAFYEEVVAEQKVQGRRLTCPKVIQQRLGWNQAVREIGAAPVREHVYTRESLMFDLQLAFDIARFFGYPTLTTGQYEGIRKDLRRTGRNLASLNPIEQVFGGFPAAMKAVGGTKVPTQKRALADVQFAMAVARELGIDSLSRDRYDAIRARCIAAITEPSDQAPGRYLIPSDAVLKTLAFWSIAVTRAARDIGEPSATAPSASVGVDLAIGIA